jgi:uncharacterized SAM-binding protein YcdF (DUF218 family)
MKGIITLSASKERMEKRLEGAISLYLQDPENSFLLLSGYGWHSFNINSIAKKYGIPYGKILIEEKSRTTKENALYCKKLIEKIGIREISIVSDSPHIARVKKIFNEQFKDYKKNFYAVPIGLKIFVYLPSEILSWIKLFLDKKSLLDQLISSYRKKFLAFSAQELKN